MGLAKELRARREVSRREIKVAEWGDDRGDFVFYCTPITCYDLDVLQKKHPKFLQNTSVSAMVDLIILKARDESNNKLFPSAEDRADLMGEETTVISEIAEQMFATIESVEQAEGN